jgi:hypothetical protein
LETKAPGSVERVEVEASEEEIKGAEQPLEQPMLVKSRSASPWNMLWNIFGSVAMRA